MAQSGGTVFAGGSFSQIRPPDGAAGTARAEANFVSFNAGTGAPASCNPDVTLGGASATVRALATSPDGRTLYIGGNFSAVGGVNVARIAALDVATCTVTPFRTPAISSIVRGLAVTENVIYAAGEFRTVGGQVRERFAAFDARTGALLPWTANADAFGKAVAVSADRSVVLIGGDFFTVNGQDSHSIAAVDAVTGQNVRNYPRGFIPDTSTTQTITADATSFYVGNEGTGGGVFDGSLAINYSDLNQRWRNNCLGATQALVVDEGTLYAANHHHDCSSMGWFPDGRRIYLTAQRTDNAEMLAWRPELNDGNGEGIGPRALTVARAGGQKVLWVGGEFTRTNGAPQQGLTRFPAGPDTGTLATPSATAESLTTGTVKVRWRTILDPDDGNLTYRVFRNGAEIGQVRAESRWWYLPQASFTDTTAVPGTQYSYRVSVSDGTTTSAQSAAVSVRAAGADVPYASAVLRDGATLYWRYDEAAGRYGADSSPGDRNPQYMQSPGYRATANAVPGEPGYAMDFGGSAYAYSDNLAEGPTTYSAETWFNTTTTSGGKILGYGNAIPTTHNPPQNPLSGSYDRHIYMNNDGRLTFGVWTGGAQTLSSSKPYNDGQWHHVVATQGPAGMALYVDGQRVGRNSVTNAQAYRGSWRTGGDNLNGWPNQPASNFFDGLIDETAIYPGVLSQQQVIQHYTLAGGTPDVPAAPSDGYGAAVYHDDPDLYWRLDETSGNVAADSGLYGMTGQILGGVTLGQPPAITSGTSMALDGSDQGRIRSTASTGSPARFSTEAWFSTTTTSGGKLIGFGNAAEGLSNNYDKQIYMTNDGRLVFGVYAGYAATITSTRQYNDGQPHHVVGTQGPDGLALYVDGILVGTDSQTTNQGYTGYWRVGGDNLNGWPNQPAGVNFAGRIDEVAVYGHTLTAEQVANHHTLGTGSTPPDRTAPTAPADLTAGAVDQDVVLSWSPATDDVAVTGYVVHRSDTDGFTPSAATRLGEVSETSFTDTGVAAGTWYYRVVATDAAGNLSEASAQATATVAAPDTSAPSAPADVTATVNGDVVTLGWSASSDDRGVTGYTVHRSDTDGFTPSATTQIGSVSGTSFTDTGVAAGTWYYRVVATDAAGNLSEASAQATATVAAPDTSAPSAPADVTAAVSGDVVTLGWSASSDDRGVTGYTVHRSDTDGFTPSATTQIGSVSGTSFTDTGVAAGTWYYRVVATDAAGNLSEASAQATATVVPAAQPVTVVLAPTADAVVRQSEPGSNFGALNQLASR
ncbi:LamG-like jellyroll fold domain-containing protein, partial [Georgenia sp. SYP-B2076]|uniref:LamG-like jellyroll fold domain-containing protein n=1 Tax=Georgenia sp. SYP-B2076 TaxID=2495881 RepID=UPI0013DF5FC5